MPTSVNRLGKSQMVNADGRICTDTLHRARQESRTSLRHEYSIMYEHGSYLDDKKLYNQASQKRKSGFPARDMVTCDLAPTTLAYMVVFVTKFSSKTADDMAGETGDQNTNFGYAPQGAKLELRSLTCGKVPPYCSNKTCLLCFLIKHSPASQQLQSPAYEACYGQVCEEDVGE